MDNPQNPSLFRGRALPPGILDAYLEGQMRQFAAVYRELERSFTSPTSLSPERAAIETKIRPTCRRDSCGA